MGPNEGKVAESSMLHHEHCERRVEVRLLRQLLIGPKGEKMKKYKKWNCESLNGAFLYTWLVLLTSNSPHPCTGPPLWSLGKSCSFASPQTPAGVPHTRSSPEGAPPQRAALASGPADPTTAPEDTHKKRHYVAKSPHNTFYIYMPHIDVSDLDPESLQDRPDSLRDWVKILLLLVVQFLGLHTAGERGLQGEMI